MERAGINTRQSTEMFSLVGTPIGNLDDASPRMKETLALADIICCEDTRMTRHLMQALGVSWKADAQFVRADEHTITKQIELVLEALAQGRHVAFASDAGMPAISDPGSKLMDAVLAAGFNTEVIPGPTAVASAVAASGFDTAHFYFEGFLPRQASVRAKRLVLISNLPAICVLYESPKRVAQTLADLAELMPERSCVLMREITKKHEEILRASLAELASYVSEQQEIKGECVLVVDAPTQEEQEVLIARLIEQKDEGRAKSLDEAIAEALSTGEKKSQAAKRIAQDFKVSRDEVYARLRGET